MKQTTRFQKWMTLAVTALALTATLAAAHDGGKNGNTNAEIRLRARLMGPAIQNVVPEGSADFRMDDKGRTRLNVEVEHVNLPAGTTLTVAVVQGGVSTTVGSIVVSATGFGEIELESQNGAMIPAISAGDSVTVSNGATAVLTGILASM